jgi:two-component system, chemotaxis family, protein-glutamate methylesterase/glutaminase
MPGEPSKDSPRVLIVDDSALMRKRLSSLMESTGQLTVCGFAHDGNDAVTKVCELKPDVVTLDVEMPGKNGLEAIPAILDARPVPIIMVSGLTQQGAQTTLDALNLGAVDFISKPTSISPDYLRQLQAELVSKIKAVAGLPIQASKFRRRLVSTIPSKPTVRSAPAATTIGTSMAGDPPPAPREYNDVLVAIGISTGGPPALQEVFENLPLPIPPIVVVQHMPSQFTGPFSQRLNQICPFLVKEAAEGDLIKPNQILIAPGGRHLTIQKKNGRLMVAIDDGDLVSGHRPSVDKMFFSAAEIYGPNVVGVIMTGMGRDGADGCKRIMENGGRTLGQDQETSVVYGMNRVAFREGGVQKQFPLQDLSAIISSLFKHAVV